MKCIAIDNTNYKQNNKVLMMNKDRITISFFSQNSCTSSSLFSTKLIDSACYNLNNQSSIQVQCNAEGTGGIIDISNTNPTCNNKNNSIYSNTIVSFSNNQCILLPNMNDTASYGESDAVVGTTLRGNGNGNGNGNAYGLVNRPNKFAISAPKFPSASSWTSSSYGDSWSNTKNGMWSYPKYSSYFPYPAFPYDNDENNYYIDTYINNNYDSWTDITIYDNPRDSWTSISKHFTYPTTTSETYPGTNTNTYTSNIYPSSGPTTTTTNTYPSYSPTIPSNNYATPTAAITTGTNKFPLAFSIRCAPVYGPKKPYTVPTSTPSFTKKPTVSHSAVPSSIPSNIIPIISVAPSIVPSPLASVSSVPVIPEISNMPSTVPISPIQTPIITELPITVSVLPSTSSIPIEIIPSITPALPSSISSSSSLPSAISAPSLIPEEVISVISQPTTLPTSPFIPVQVNIPPSVFMQRPDDFSVTWYEESNCATDINNLDYSTVVSSVGFCQAVPDAPVEENGYRVYCERTEFGFFSGNGIFEVCGDYPHCTNCTVHSPFTENIMDNTTMCLLNDREQFGAGSMQFRCKNLQLPDVPPIRGRETLIWYGLENCNPIFRTLVDIQQKTCQRVPRGVNAGYKVDCDPFTGAGTFQICKDSNCEDCSDPIIVERNTCMANPPEYGSSSFQIQCPEINPGDLNFNVYYNITPELINRFKNNNGTNNSITNTISWITIVITLGVLMIM